MLSRNDPRLRRAIDQITHNIEAANERTQENLFTFTRNYITPCLSSVGECLRSTCDPCLSRLNSDDERRRRQRSGRQGGRAEQSFDFYDDWEQDDDVAGLLGDEREPLLGSGSPLSSSLRPQPPRERQMNYGTRKQRASRKALGKMNEQDGGNIIHSSSYFGFLERLPFRMGAKGLRYQPSIADLQDNPGSKRVGDAEEEQALLDDPNYNDYPSSKRRHKRTRSNTQGSGHTIDSLSSRGDIFPSEDEMDDAIPIDDEFALHLERRTTGNMTEDSSSGRRDAAHRSNSRLSLLTISSKGSQGSKKKRKAIQTEDIHRDNVTGKDLHEVHGEIKEETIDSRIDSALPSAVASEPLSSPPTSPLAPQISSTSPAMTLSKPSSISGSIHLPSSTNANDHNHSQLSHEEPSPSTNIHEQSESSDFNAAALPHFKGS
jgi:hypothetical protein